MREDSMKTIRSSQSRRDFYILRYVRRGHQTESLTQEVHLEQTDHQFSSLLGLARRQAPDLTPAQGKTYLSNDFLRFRDTEHAANCSV